MKLWILKPIDENAKTIIREQEVKRWTWDCSYGFVVRAKDERGARGYAKDHAGFEGDDAWLDPTLTSCEVLTNKGEPGIVLQDFLNG